MVRVTSPDVQGTPSGEMHLESPPAEGQCGASIKPVNRLGYRIALLTPYTGGNFGDAAIQDSMIANLGLLFPNAEFSGISLNNENYLRQHGTFAFPLCASGLTFYGMSSDTTSPGHAANLGGLQGFKSILKLGLRRIPGVARLLGALKPHIKALRSEILHCTSGYHFLKDHELIVVCGGGQLDEEWGGPWGHPFALFKWAMLSRLAGVPLVIASVGACKVQSRLSRFFLSQALRRSCYRSYRDEESKQIASGFFRHAANDSVVPDLAFGLPESEFPKPSAFEVPTTTKAIVAISPIIYAKPGFWPLSDRSLYEQYLDKLAEAVTHLLQADSFLIFLWSARSDESAIPELISRLDAKSMGRLQGQALFPNPATWKELLALLRSAEYLIASRLHSSILGFVAQVPVVAISFDAKVDRVMEDLGQTEALLQIASFEASDVIETLKMLEMHRDEVIGKLRAYLRQSLEASGRQYEALARIAIAAGTRRRGRGIDVPSNRSE